MADDLLDQVTGTLRDAGTTLKADLWQPEDEAVLKARAADLIDYNEKAASTDDPAKKAAYHAAAVDVLNQVRDLAMMRVEIAAKHLVDDVEQFFVGKLLPAVVALLPKLIGIL